MAMALEEGFEAKAEGRTDPSADSRSAAFGGDVSVLVLLHWTTATT